jgi:uncharacterized protein YndB with AHSA1/START domain
MVDILHRIGAEGSTPEKVYEALTTLRGLSAWWMENTSGNTGLGGVIEFPIGLALKVGELDPGRLVRWEVIDGPAEWVGTGIRWDLHQDDGWTIVLLKHQGWREPVEFMHHCSTKWATHLMSLKQLVETGVGTPNPGGTSVGNWG